MQSLGVGNSGLKTYLHSGFCQDVAVWLSGNKIKIPPGLWAIVPPKPWRPQRAVAGVGWGLRGVCGVRGGHQHGLDSLKTFLRLQTWLQIEHILAYLLAVCMAPTGCVTLGKPLNQFGPHDILLYPRELDQLINKVLQLYVQSPKCTSHLSSVHKPTPHHPFKVQLKAVATFFFF